MSKNVRSSRAAKANEIALVPESTSLRTSGVLDIHPDRTVPSTIQRMDRNLEPFVTAKEAAAFLCLTVRRVLEMARSGQLPAHPLGVGPRHTWRFRLSELAHALVPGNSHSRSGTIVPGSPSGPGQEK